MVKKIGFGILAVFIVIQCFRPSKNVAAKELDKDIQKVVNVPEDMLIILEKACYDCHSNTTNYPWYAEIMPVGWILDHHVDEGKEHLNFSEFATYPKEKQDHKLEECIEEIQEHEMPIASYTWTHQQANLSEKETQKLIEWLTLARTQLK
ncbi:MAG: heme-binding domain-containing protein [Cytophagales bacterium]|nr:heme-binding domain-containing protein [Cytophagales bacterium]